MDKEKLKKILKNLIGQVPGVPPVWVGVMHELLNEAFAEPETVGHKTKLAKYEEKYFIKEPSDVSLEKKDAHQFTPNKIEGYWVNAFQAGREDMKKEVGEVFILTETGLNTSNSAACQIMYNKLKELLK